MAGRGVLIVAHDEDEHGKYLVEILLRRELSVVRVSYDDINLRPFLWAPGSKSVGHSSVSRRTNWAGLWRRAGTIDVSSTLGKYSEFAISEWRDAFEGALASANVRWLSEIAAMRRAELKLVQLDTARHLRIPYPATLVTNDPATAMRFAAKTQCLMKPIRYGLVSTKPLRMAWTRPVEERELREIHGPPVMLQERIRVDYHLRIITVGEHAFPSRLRTTDLDWRVSVQNHDSFEPSSEARDKRIGREAVRLATAMNVRFSAQDWVVSNEGKGYFLDLNPNGQWMFLENAWNGAIGEAIGNALEAIAS